MPHRATSRLPERLADGLGWASVGLGVPMVAAPGPVLRAVGAREHLHAGAILVLGRRRAGAWSRVAGDLLDGGLFAAGALRARRDGDRVAKTAVVLGAILAADAAVAAMLARRGPEGGQSSTHVRTALTIRLPEDDVRRRWREHDWQTLDPRALEDAGEVSFRPAPGDRGTEIHLDHVPRVRGGALGAAIGKAAGKAPDQEIEDELRRFKALAETGVVAVSDKSPEGPRAARQRRQRPGQPVGGRA